MIFNLTKYNGRFHVIEIIETLDVDLKKAPKKTMKIDLVKLLF